MIIKTKLLYVDKMISHFPIIKIFYDILNQILLFLLFKEKVRLGSIKIGNFNRFIKKFIIRYQNSVMRC